MTTGRAPTVRELRAWERRAAAILRSAGRLTSDMIAVVGLEYEAGGENMTSQADDTAASAENLACYLDFCASLAKRDRR